MSEKSKDKIIEEWSADQIYGIMEGGTKGIEKIVNRIFVDKKDIIAEFLTDINIIDNLYGKESITILIIREKWEGENK